MEHAYGVEEGELAVDGLVDGGAQESQTLQLQRRVQRLGEFGMVLGRRYVLNHGLENTGRQTQGVYGCANLTNVSPGAWSGALWHRMRTHSGPGHVRVGLDLAYCGRLVT